MHIKTKRRRSRAAAQQRVRDRVCACVRDGAKHEWLVICMYPGIPVIGTIWDMRYECMTMEAFNRTPKMAVFIWYLVSRFTFYTIYFVAQGQTT